MVKKIISIAVIFVIAIILIQNTVFAYNWKNEISGADSWKGDNGIVNTTKTVMGTGIAVIRTVGTGIAIIMLTYVAIKYMTAAPNEKAEFKKSATAFIVGAIVLFASTNILGIIADFATANIKTTETEATTSEAVVKIIDLDMA